MNLRMRLRLLTGLAATLLTGSVSGAELVEKIVARVNDRLITNSEFQKRLETAAHGPQPVTDPTLLKKDVLDELGSRDEISYIHTMLQQGSGADRQLRVFRETNDLKAVVDYMAAETRAGL